jgi:hypothetical protein
MTVVQEIYKIKIYYLSLENSRLKSCLHNYQLINLFHNVKNYKLKNKNVLDTILDIRTFYFTKLVYIDTQEKMHDYPHLNQPYGTLSKFLK